jgi:hypothetical protein
MKCKRIPPHKPAKKNQCTTCCYLERKRINPIYKKKVNIRIKLMLKKKMQNLEYRTRSNKKWLNAYRRRKYGITDDQYIQILESQDGLCKICKRPPKQGQILCIDHNHSTGVNRGLLCRGCNSHMGYFEKYNIVENMVEYLKENIYD